MSSVAFISEANRARIRRAEAWLEGRPAAEELLIVGTTRDAANELPREILSQVWPLEYRWGAATRWWFLADLG